MSAATTGVEADVDPSSSGLIRDQGCKASAAGFMEDRPGEEGRQHESNQESRSTERVQGEGQHTDTTKGLVGFLPLTRPTTLSSIAGGVECLHCWRALGERELEGRLGLCQWCLDRNDEYLIDRKRAPYGWNSQGHPNKSLLSKECQDQGEDDAIQQRWPHSEKEGRAPLVWVQCKCKNKAVLSANQRVNH